MCQKEKEKLAEVTALLCSRIRSLGKIGREEEVEQQVGFLALTETGEKSSPSTPCPHPSIAMTFTSCKDISGWKARIMKASCHLIMSGTHQLYDFAWGKSFNLSGPHLSCVRWMPTPISPGSYEDKSYRGECFRSQLLKLAFASELQEPANPYLWLNRS